MIAPSSSAVNVEVKDTSNAPVKHSRVLGAAPSGLSVTVRARPAIPVLCRCVIAAGDTTAYVLTSQTRTIVIRLPNILIHAVAITAIVVIKRERRR